MADRGRRMGGTGARARLRGRLAVALVSAPAALTVLLLLAGSTLANGIGDLYAATPDGVLELHVDSARVVNTVDIRPAPRSLAFSPDGRSLYVASNGRHVTRIDIESLTTPDLIALPTSAASLAFPAGATLVIALPEHRTLGLVAVPSTAVVESEPLPGAVNLLAADRHDPRVAAAKSGESWVAVYTPADGALRKTTVKGGIAALAIDRDRGAVLVATSAPDRLYRLDLRSLEVTWQQDLPAAPVGVAATTGAAVVASGTTLWTVDSSGVKPWATTKAAIVTIDASDDGHVVHAAEGDTIQAFDESGHAARLIRLPAGQRATALAAVPAGSSIYGVRGSGRPGTSAGRGSAPATSTLGGPLAIVTEAPLAGAAAVAGLVLLLYFLGFRVFSARRSH